MLSIGIAIFGIISLLKLPVGLMPRVEYPALSVIVEYPGISPDKIENIITRPIERIIRTVPGIETIESSSEEGKSRITITLHPGIDTKLIALKVREKIGLIRDSFPRAVQEPVVLRYDPSDRPALIASVKKIPLENASLTDIREYAEHVIKPQLQRIDGVSEIYAAGGLRKEIHVTIDSGKFFSRKMDFGEIVRTLQSESVSMPAGNIFSGGKEWRIRIPERFKTKEDISAVALRLFDEGKIISLGEIARVEESSHETDSIARQNGREGVLLYLHRAGDANTLEVVSRAQTILSSLPGCEIEIIYNMAEFIRAAVNNAVSSSLWGLAIVIFVILLFYRDILKAGTIALSIPLSITAVFSCMYFARFEINIVSLCGIALSAGMVVDSGILVMEAITHGMSLQSAARAVGRIRIAATASVVTTASVFFPLLFAEETVRRTYEGIAFTVTVSCIVSLFVATSLLPSLYLAAKRALSLPPLRIKLFCALEHCTDTSKDIFASALSFVFAYRKKTLIATAIFMGLAMVSLICIPTELTDPFGNNEAYLYCELPTGTPLRIADEAIKRVEERLKYTDTVKKISSKTEKWRGSIAITLKNFFWAHERENAKKLIAHHAREALMPFGGFAFISEAGELADRELDIIFTGKDDTTLRHIAREAAKAVGAVAGIEECVLRFREGKPSYRLMLKREKSEMFNASSEHLAHFFHGALFGPVAVKHHTDGREIDVRVKFDRKSFSRAEDLLAGSIPVAEDRLVPLREIVHIEKGTEPTRLTRHNGRRAVRITARLGEISYDNAEEKIRKALAAITFPEDYSWEFDTAYIKARTQLRAMALLVLAALVLVYMTMAAILESLRLPLLVLATVPPGICGVFLTFFLSGSPMNSSAFMGIVVLVGIAVNNGIVIVERTAFIIRQKKKAREKDEIDKIAKHVSLEHFRPLFATTLTTIAGFFPALVSFGEGSFLWRPLALTVISGLSFSFLASGLLLPVCIRFFISHSGRKI